MMPTLRFSCPVDDCKWFVDETPAEAEREMKRGIASPYVSTVTPAGMAAGTEDRLVAHAATHTPLEYLRTIARQREELDRLKMENSRDHS